MPRAGSRAIPTAPIGGAGWGHTGGVYTFSPSSTTGTATATATNNAGVAGAGTTFTARVDSTGPTGGALSVNGTAATGGGSSSYLNAGTTLTIDSRTNFSETQDATHSGLASSTLTIESATLSGDNCGTLRLADDDHRHHVTDRRQRQLLPADAHRHRQRRQRDVDQHRRQGRHDARRPHRPPSGSAR